MNEHEQLRVLESKVDRLELLVRELVDSVRQSSGGAKLYPRFFPAAMDNDGIWQEVDVGNDGIVAFAPDGREFSENDILANDTLQSSGFIEIPGSKDGDPVLWKVRIGAVESCLEEEDLVDGNDLIVIGDSVMGDGTDTVEWDRSSDEVPFEEWDVTDVYWSGTVLYAVKRLHQYDSCGKCVHVGPEVLSEVNTPVTCSGS